MSTINCDSCANLREYAPEFVQSGVTDTVAASLKNNTGFNPSLTVLRDNCTDLNDANDCLIGRMGEQLPAYDVCDWKEFMSKLLPNQYEVLKAIIAGNCGQWAMLDRTCTSIDNVLRVAMQATPEQHACEWTELGAQKIKGGGAWEDEHVKLFAHSEILRGVGCSLSRCVHRTALSIGSDKSYYPASGAPVAVEDLAVGDVLAYIRKAQLVPDYFPDGSFWEGALRGGYFTGVGLINGDTFLYLGWRGYVVINGVAYNEDLRSYGEDTLCVFVSDFVGPSRRGTLRQTSPIAARNVTYSC